MMPWIYRAKLVGGTSLIWILQQGKTDNQLVQCTQNVVKYSNGH
jgi:hypothetical protein